MLWYKQSTAASLIVGPILDSTGAEYGSAVIGDLSLSKNGGTLTALASAATLTYIANGYYTLALTTGNTDTLGRAEISCNKSTYQMPPRELMVLPATVYDALVTNATNGTGGLLAATGTVSAAAGYLGATGAAVNGTNVNTLASHDPGATIGTSTLTQAQVTGGAYAMNSASFAFNAALDFTTTQKAATIARVTLVDTITTYTGDTPQTGDSFARIGATGSGLTSLAPASTALSTATWSNTRAGYLDNLSGGAVALASGVAVSSLAANSITAASIAADTGLKSVRSNTAQAGASDSITLDASASSTGGIYTSQIIHLTGGTGAGQTRLITNYNGTTKVATVSRGWGTNPDNTTTFAVLPVTGYVDMWSIVGDASKADYLSLMLGDGTFTADMTGCNFPDVSVSALSQTAIGEAVWTSGTRTLTALDEDGTTLDLDATIRAAVGLAGANLDTQLDAVADAVAGGGYAGGAVWFDTNGANTGTTFGVDGTAANPCNTLARALTVAAAAPTPMKKLFAATGSWITLGAALEGYDLDGGVDYLLVLNGQSISGTAVRNCFGVSGTATGTDPSFFDCAIGTVTLPPCEMQRCHLNDVLTVGSAGNFQLVDCSATTYGSSVPTIDLGAAVGATAVSLRRWSGSLTLDNVKAGDTVTIDAVSGGTITVNGTGGSVIVNGIITVVDGSGGSVTITQTRALNTAAIATAVLAAGDVDGFTLEETLKLCLAALAAKLSGAGTTTITIRAADDSKDRITATVDASGNRTAVTLDAAG